MEISQLKSETSPPSSLSSEYKQYAEEEAKKPVSDRYLPPKERKLANELYGSRMGQGCFIIGSGPSIKKAERSLQEPTHGTFRIAINEAITKVPAEYWMFIDSDAYLKWKDHPNAKNAIKLGVDRFWMEYADDVVIWRRAFSSEDVKAGRLVHRSTTLIPAMHLSFWLGATDVITVGCDNYEPADSGWDATRKDIMNCTFLRINHALVKDMPYIAPSWVKMVDVSGGDLLLPKSNLFSQLAKLRKKHGSPISH